MNKVLFAIGLGLIITAIIIYIDLKYSSKKNVKDGK